MTTRSVDVAVVGGGPAGYAAALAAARRGASVVLAEPELLGGACVHWSCIPTNVLLSSALVSLEARELTFHGVLAAGDDVDLRRLGVRRASLVRMLAGGIGAALRNAKVEVLKGRATLAPSLGVTVAVDGAEIDVHAASVVVAAGSRWEVPTIPGLDASRVLTADLVQALDAAPPSAVVLGGGPADTAFAVEYAFLLAACGTSVTLVVPGDLVVPGLDAELDPAVTAALTTVGVEVVRHAAVIGADGMKATVTHADGESVVGADVVVVADRRVPAVDGVGFAAGGVALADGAVVVDSSCRTSSPSTLAAGDVTGGPMLTAAALHMGAVAGTVAAGGSAQTRLDAVPHVLHTLPGVGWIGRSETAARGSGVDVAVAIVDLGGNPRSVALGARDGYLKLVADAATGEILGIHVVGPDAAELLAVASTAMQAELTASDLAATVPWHPSLTESLVDAARQLT